MNAESKLDILLLEVRDLGSQMAALKAPEKPTEDDHYMGTKQLKEYTSFSDDFIRRHVNERTIPHYKVKGKIVYKKSEIDEWIKTFTRPYIKN